MAKKKIPGVNTSRKRLADGTVREYFYHRATGEPLPGTYGSAEFLAAYVEAEKVKPKDVGNINALIRDYLQSLKFEKKRDSTQREYKRMLLEIEKRFGKLPVKALESPRIRGVFIEYQEEIGRDRPREADNRLSVLSAVLTHAASKGNIRENPLKGFERIYDADRSEMIWTDGDVATFMQAAPLELQQAMILAIHTGQRYGDLIRLRWADYDGTNVSLKQNKTKARVTIHASTTLRLMLDSMERRGPYILTRDDGRPWFTEKNDKEMGKQWAAHMVACGLRPTNFAELAKTVQREYLRFNDLRGTAVTLLSEAGNGIPQICGVTGHTLESATRIIAKYLAMTPALSKAAIVAFENSPATAFANRLQTVVRGTAQPNQKVKG
ncbi:MAG: tyrosine-type recombinase/integrase [Paracoccus sp. (in: a-proteobacteria)]|uniref:tyrosine-type recombinase/integrase n=1 Tax=Paracoccus sp. TaxID=267 RepID=UPI0026E02C8E|nr:tyrosine-type recombinase/integrase [Paracoccus sp. (in: a-proteobacteria)]MDO5613621.1 tyrosine-type recombinase/integrase [Paracoccus sp. (in: a-proteobacteria)]